MYKENCNKLRQLKEEIMFFLLFAASIGAASPASSVGSHPKEAIHLTSEMLIGIADEIIRLDIAEVDIDPAVFDIPSGSPKAHKKNELDEVEFITEADKPPSLN